MSVYPATNRGSYIFCVCHIPNNPKMQTTEKDLLKFIYRSFNGKIHIFFALYPSFDIHMKLR